MKKIILALILLPVLAGCSQDKSAKEAENTRNRLEINRHKTETFELFPTQNMWTFIKLDTRNGRMWQVQFDVQGDNRMETILNDKPLVTSDKETYGRFTLYATQNIFNFILLDKMDGGTWQVQWSIDENKRGIVPISGMANP